jgi:triosephosphate isomerase
MTLARPRPVIVAANWKMHTTPADAGGLAATIARRTNEPDVVRVICPPFVCLGPVRDALSAEPAGRDVAVGAQDVHHELAGAFTGEVSAPMLVGLATWVIVGHSERRRYAGETDALINEKVRRARDARLRVILCVGEQLAEREAGRAEEVVRAQVRGCLEGVEAPALADWDASSPAPWLTIAYEPVWAIGTGEVATPEDAQEVCGAIRGRLAELYSQELADAVRIQYGGSVKSGNVAAIMAQPDVDGALIGGAALDADEFVKIVRFRDQ